MQLVLDRSDNFIACCGPMSSGIYNYCEKTAIFVSRNPISCVCWLHMMIIMYLVLVMFSCPFFRTRMESILLKNCFNYWIPSGLNFESLEPEDNFLMRNHSI